MTLPLSLLPFAIESLGESSVAQECLFELPQLLIEQVVSLMDQANGRVRGNFRRRRFNIGPIGHIGPILLVSEPPDHRSSGVILTPEEQAALA